jgi:POT family proton-dependent oligopeptide transporter
MSEASTQQGHPKGLYLLFTTEMWERFSYYGMRALFTLYLTKALLFDKALASAIYGDYTGLVYLTPLIGGFVADRYWGNRKSIIVGGVLMAIGQLLMFTSGMFYTTPSSATAIMLLGLLALIVGNGFFKPNISTMVGQLYPQGDKRIDAAFTIFYMGINLGAFIAPLACGAVGDTGDPADFKWGFLAACIGMILSLIIFISMKNKYIVTPDGSPIGGVPEKVVPTIEEKAASAKVGNGRAYMWLAVLISLYLLFKGVLGLDIIGSFIFACTIAAPGYIITDPSLDKIERSRIWVIYIIAFFVIAFWAAFEQAGASLTFFAEEQTDRNLFGWFEIPASAFQSVNPILIVALAPLFAMLWVRLGKKNKEPASPMKQSIGLFMVALGYVIIAMVVKDLGPGVKVSMVWLFSLYAIHTMGELCLSPIGLSMVVKLAPIRYSSLLMGVWFLSTALANKVAGDLSAYYPEDVHKKSAYGAPKFAANFNGFDSTIVVDAGTNFFANNAKPGLWTVATTADNKKEAPEKTGVDKFMHNMTADPLVDYFTAAEETDVVTSVAIQTEGTPKIEEHKLKQITPKDEKTKFSIGVSRDGNTAYVLKMTPDEINKEKMNVAFETWDLNPKKPSIFGQEIKNMYEFFVVFIILAGVASVLLFFLSKRLLKMMHGLR